MRVSTDITPETRSSVAGGWFSSRPPVTEYFVNVKIELTQEERAVLDQCALWDHGLHKTTFRWSDDYLEKHPKFNEDNNSPVTHTIRDYVVGFKPHGFFRWKFFTPAEAAAFQLKVENEILPLLKKVIQENTQISELPTSKRTFEL
jgi:hypothetical protein